MISLQHFSDTRVHPVLILPPYPLHPFIADHFLTPEGRGILRVTENLSNKQTNKNERKNTRERDISISQVEYQSGGDGNLGSIPSVVLLYSPTPTPNSLKPLDLIHRKIL